MHPYKTYIFVDIEAALINGKQRIIEIGAIKWSPEQSINTFEHLIKPHKFKKLNRHIQQLTGITTEELLTAPSFLTVIRKFMNWCGGDKVFVTFGEFDRKVLEEEFARYHLNVDFLFPIVDYQQKYMIEHQLKNQPSLNSLMEVLELEIGEQHRALADAYSLLKIFDKTKGIDLIENQKTNEFCILLCDMIQKEAVYELNVTSIFGNVSNNYIEINNIKTVNRNLSFIVKDVERLTAEGEKTFVQVTDIQPNHDIQLFLNEIIEQLHKKVLISLQGLKNLSKITRIHGSVIPKTETISLKHLIKNEDELNLFKLNEHTLSSSAFEMKLLNLLDIHQAVIIEEFNKRNLLNNEIRV